MKIKELTVRQVRIPLRKPIKHASHTRTETDNLLVRCVLEDGTTGYGEGVPRDYVTGENIDSALTLLAESDLPGQLVPCDTFERAVQVAEQLRLRPVPGDDRACQGNAARCAVELAFLDAYGKHFRMRLAEITRLLAPELHKPVPWVRYSGAIMSARGFKARLAGWVMWFYRFKQLKVKVGIAGYDDPERLRIIRKRVGRKMDLRVDANEAWSPAQVVPRIQALLPHNITSVEQPVRHEDVACLAEVRKQVGVPIMLDESLCGKIDAERAATHGWCDLFNVRLSKCGGFIPSLRLAQFARRRGLGYQLGCQVGETAVLSAAGRAFASSVADIRYLEGSYDRRLVKEALGTKDITFRWGGWAPALEGPGLGIELDARAIDRVTVREVRLIG